MNNGNLTFYFLTMCQKVVGKPLRVKYNRYYPRYFSRVATVCRKKQISSSELHMFNVISSIDRAMLQTYLKLSMVNCQDNFHWLQSLIPLLIILYNLRIFSRHYYCDFGQVFSGTGEVNWKRENDTVCLLFQHSVGFQVRYTNASLKIYRYLCLCLKVIWLRYRIIAWLTFWDIRTQNIRNVCLQTYRSNRKKIKSSLPFLKIPTSQVNNKRILSFKNWKFSRYCFYMNPDIYWMFQICISLTLKAFNIMTK